MILGLEDQSQASQTTLGFLKLGDVDSEYAETTFAEARCCLRRGGRDKHMVR